MRPPHHRHCANFRVFLPAIFPGITRGNTEAKVVRAPRHIPTGKRLSRAVSFPRWRWLRKYVGIRLRGGGRSEGEGEGDNRCIPASVRIHLTTIKVFTAPRRTTHFEIWHLSSYPLQSPFSPSSSTTFYHPRFYHPLYLSLSLSPRLILLFQRISVHRNRIRNARGLFSPPPSLIPAWFSILFTSSFRPLFRNNSGKEEQNATVSANWWERQ